LRQHLGIERWLLFGGSWGSTLALAYGESHRERCLGMVLRGVFLFRPQEVEWFLSGMGLFYPEAARRFQDFLPPPERGEPLRAYHRRLISPDPAIHLPAARAWCAYEEACSRLIPPPPAAMPPAQIVTNDGLAMARLEAHYMVNHGFLARDQLIADANRLAGLPAIIVQGRYDVICPPASAFDLARAWPDAELHMIPDGGHAAMDPGIRDALVAAVDRIADRL
ncbi:MAG: alpha/beta fold hydrolase, partial [Alphaproteobacteria bacterium]|nr:alpha/beta fold hydrolase [Alphaproteobacteria bacterium]